MVTDYEKLYHMRICSLHFEENMMRKYRLTEDAVPTLNLEAPSATSLYEEHSYFRDGNLEVGHYVEIDESVPDYRIDVISRSIGTQTDLLTVNMGTKTCYVDTSDCQIQTEKELSARTPRKLRLKKEIKDQKANMKLKNKEKARLQLLYDKQVNQREEISKASFKKACDDHLPDFFGNMAKHVSDLKDQKLKGRKYTVEFKHHALSIYYQSPRLYKRLAQKYHFPSISTLRRITGNIQQPPGLSDFMFEHLERKMSGKGKLEKMCVLTMDEVSLKANFYYNIKRDEIIGFEEYMLRLFIRMRTYYVIEYANRKFQTEELHKRQERRNRKLDNLKHN